MLQCGELRFGSFSHVDLKQMASNETRSFFIPPAFFVNISEGFYFAEYI